MTQEKLKKIDAEKELNDIKVGLEEFFDYIKRSCSKKKFDMNMSKEHLTSELTKRYLNGDYKQIVGDLSESILVSYMLKRNKDNVDDYNLTKAEMEDNLKEVENFVSTQDLKISKPFALISKFLSDISTKEQTYNCSTLDDVKKSISKIVMDEIEDTFGNNIYLKYLTTVDIGSAVKAECKDRGYELWKKKPFAVKAEANDLKVAKNQELLMSIYIHVVKNYIKDYTSQMKREIKEDDFNMLWNTVEDFLNNAQERMSEATKNNPKFLQYKQQADNFFNNTINQIYSTYVIEAKHGPLYHTLKTSFEHFENGDYTKQDIDIVRDFYSRIVKLNEALSVVGKDENGEFNYPANYFVVMPIDNQVLSDCFKKLDDVNKKYNIISDYDENMVASTKTLINKSFKRGLIPSSSAVCEPEKFLAVYKGQKFVYKNGVTVDISTEKEYEKFVERVVEVLEKNKLRKTQECVSIVASYLSKGREAICMPNTKLEKVKEL